MNKSVLVINSGSLPVPATSGGAIQQVFGELVKGLTNLKWNVGVITCTTSQSKEEQKTFHASVRWYDIEQKLSSGGIRGIYVGIIELRKKLQVINEKDYSSVIIYDPYLAPTLKKWNKNIKVIWSVHNTREKTAPLVKYWSKYIDEIVCVSMFLEDKIKKVVRRKAKFSVIHNPIEQKWLDEERTVRKVPRSILYCGRIVPEKGIDIMIKSLSVLPQDLKKKIKLGIAGASHFHGSTENEYTKYIRNLLQTSGINYEMLGYVNHNDLIKVYDQYEVLIIPSNWAEPAPLVAAEGQARDCKVISTTAGGLPELIAPYWRSFLVNPGDIDHLSNAIKKVLIEEHTDYWVPVKDWIEQKFGKQSIMKQWDALLTS